jgi:phosphopantothenoylcysteine synthetase/decarboxylase
MHPATQEHVERLRVRGAEFVGPAEGSLACDYEGLGRLSEVNEIVEYAQRVLARA